MWLVDDAGKSRESRMSDLADCTLCPRECHANRLADMAKTGGVVNDGVADNGVVKIDDATKICSGTKNRDVASIYGQAGACGVTGEDVALARAALHMWEEPCISGENGSGAVFFCGCPLHCVYCQNEAISRARAGKRISVRRLAEIFLELQGQKAANINLVTPTHYTPQIIRAVELARNQGLTAPIVYNCSGYEKVDTLKMLEGIVDVYLTDFKYMETELAAKYSHSADYPRVAKAALAEMVRQMEMHGARAERQEETMHGAGAERQKETMHGVGAARAGAAFDEGGMMQKGVIVRHLLLPGHLQNAKKVVYYVYQAYGNRVYLSLMNQYTPMQEKKEIFERNGWPQMNRRVTKREYERLVEYAISLGVENGFIQEGETAKESFIPAFDNEGV